MQAIRVDLRNCYGIKSLKAEFDFSQTRAVAIYAPNGAMKSSFAETFMDVANGQPSRDRIFPKRTTTRKITDHQNAELKAENVVVLRPYDEVFGDASKTSTLLVDSSLRKEYEKLIKDIEEAKEAFLKAIKEVSGSKRLDEGEISSTFTSSREEFYVALVRVKQEVIDQSNAPYADIKFDRVFDDKILTFLATKDFKTALQSYIQRYNQLISESQYFRKGTFNYYNASTVAKNLAANGFFEAKHMVTLTGGENVEIKSEQELAALIQKEKDAITGDADLRKKFAEIEKRLEKNIDLRNFHAYLLENEILLPHLANIERFKDELLKSYFKTKSELYLELVDRYLKTEKRKREIEEAAGEQRTQWERVIEIFNNRFFVPFRLVPTNKVAVMLKENTPLSLSFSFKDGADEAVLERDALLKALSTGEKKALYVLNIIFEVEARIKSKQDTIFVVDDIADSFDYKNKYAIIEYLRDISEVLHFSQIILTHNFDFFRTISSRFVHRNNCFMAFKTEEGLLLDKAEGVTNIFMKDWKTEFFSDPKKKIASIPFIRNMIEFTKGPTDPEYIKLTSLLHWKEPDTGTITIGDLDNAFQSVFGGTEKSADSAMPVAQVMADTVADCLKASQGFNFENKIVLSIGIRLLAEQYMIKRLADPAFVASIKHSQTGKLFGRFKEKFGSEEATIRVLQKVILMTPESIHLNSFMYEPILDMSDEHLRRLYSDMLSL
jgi:ABC-type Mn2+/Zn2+ transport system ATPase subunit